MIERDPLFREFLEKKPEEAGRYKVILFLIPQHEWQDDKYEETELEFDGESWKYPENKECVVSYLYRKKLSS